MRQITHLVVFRFRIVTLFLGTICTCSFASQAWAGNFRYTSPPLGLEIEDHVRVQEDPQFESYLKSRAQEEVTNEKYRKAEVKKRYEQLEVEENQRRAQVKKRREQRVQRKIASVNQHDRAERVWQAKHEQAEKAYAIKRREEAGQAEELRMRRLKAYSHSKR
ncbi:MAG: hypothetical protein COT74_00095 [Bdellovibrionales bacterium CG10_big_fil_rev_8_21_14_0_10_45_34]|nr:MAG: hypothetical protein COT74_00095 [Bdellovibrionales bacterium CG10_big_fil_rev_8_21_14_0_10_45_34]